MKFLSVRNGGNEFALAGAVKEIVTRWRSSLPKKKMGGPSPMSSSAQAYQLTSAQAWDIIRLER